MNLFRRARPAPIPIPEPHHQSENPLFRNPANEYRRWRFIVVGWLVILLVLGGVAWWVFGPVTRITSVEVSGTIFIAPQSVEKLATYYLDRPTLFVLPTRQTFFLGASQMKGHIEKRISARISIVGVDVRIKEHHILQIIVHERLPVAVWTVGAETGWLDTNGIIVNVAPAPAGLGLPVVIDDGGLPFRLNDSVVDASVAKSLQLFHDALNRYKFSLTAFHVPLPTCLVIPPDTTNTNTGTTNSNANTNSTGELLNLNIGLANTNTAPSPVIPCNEADIRRQRPEIDVQLKDGPFVRFDRYNDVETSVQSLQRIMGEKEGASAKTIDLRFIGRAYIK